MLAKIIIFVSLFGAMCSMKAQEKNKDTDKDTKLMLNETLIAVLEKCSNATTDEEEIQCVTGHSNDTYKYKLFIGPLESLPTIEEINPKIRHSQEITFFSFDEEISAKKVKRAAIWFFVKKPAQQASNKLNINLFKILETGFTGASGSRESPVITSVKVDSTQSIPNGSGAWITMEYIQIKNLVSEWFRYPQHNLGIVLTAEDANRTNLAVTSHTGNNTAYLPFLEVYVTDNRKHRTKRTVGLNCKDSSKETRCCRYPLTVDFLEFGWDWIIAPRKYEAFYCAGECPPAFLPQYPHTYVSQLANTPGNGPCCAPRKLSELEMLYFDQNMNIIFGRIPAMKVDRCGCT